MAVVRPGGFLPSLRGNPAKGDLMDRWAKYAPWTGIVSVALIVIAFIVGGESPDFDDSTQKVISFYTDNHSSQVIASLLLTYGAVLLVFFAATLRSALSGAEVVSRAILVGGGLMALGMVVFAGLTFTLADLAHSDHVSRIEPSTFQSLNALNSDFFLPLVLGVSIFLISSALAVLKSGAFPAWMGWFALVLGIAALTPAGFFAFLLSGLWIIIAAVMMLTGGRSSAEGGAAPAVAP
jgi:hypothetical protein